MINKQDVGVDADLNLHYTFESIISSEAMWMNWKINYLKIIVITNKIKVWRK